MRRPGRSAVEKHGLKRRYVIDQAEKRLRGGPCQKSFGVKALHIFERRLHGGEAIPDHVPFVGGERLNQVCVSTSYGGERAAKRRRVSQSSIGADSAEWR